MSTSKIIRTLWDAANTTEMTDEQLEALSCGDTLANSLENLSEAVMGIGCLVYEDGSNGGKAGNFQDPESMANLLWVISDQISTASAASFVAADATALLHLRAQKKSGKRQEKTVS